MSKKPVVLMVLDGYGLSDHKEGNAIAMANTPVMDKLMAECPFVKGAASGLAVGLPDGQMGNSEVGHMNIGAGRIIYQDLTRITKAIADGDFFKNEGTNLLQSKTARRMTPICIFGDFFQMVVFTAISSIFMDFLSLAKQQRVLTEYMYTRSLMDVIHRLHQAKDYIEQLVD